MPAAELEERCTAALTRAGERVREIYCMECASARQELRRLQTALQEVEEDNTVRIKQI